MNKLLIGVILLILILSTSYYILVDNSFEKEHFEDVQSTEPQECQAFMEEIGNCNLFKQCYKTCCAQPESCNPQTKIALGLSFGNCPEEPPCNN